MDFPPLPPVLWWSRATRQEPRQLQTLLWGRTYPAEEGRMYAVHADPVMQAPCSDLSPVLPVWSRKEGSMREEGRFLPTVSWRAELPIV